jgi:D-amino peptidase
MFVGYHGRAGRGPGVLAHTMSPMLLDVRLNGQPVGEIGANAFLAGHHGAPVVFLSGDALACEELRDLAPGAVTVAVKEALGQGSARTRHPELAREQIREAAATAIRQLDQVQPVIAEGPVELEIDLYRPHVVDLASLIPGVVRRDGARTIAFTARDMAEAYRVIELVTELGQIEPS